MIGEIIGIIKRIYESYIIVFVGDGLGYKINLPPKITLQSPIKDFVSAQEQIIKWPYLHKLPVPCLYFAFVGRYVGM